MTIDLHTRRSIRKIARADFDAFPVWEWAINEDQSHGHEESFVRPTALGSLSLELVRQYIVSATVTLSDGSALPGCVEVSVRNGKPHMEPMFIFLQDRHLDFGGAETRTVLCHYTKNPDARPERWQLAVAFDGESAPRQEQVRRSLLSRLAQRWKRVSLAAQRARVTAP